MTPQAVKISGRFSDRGGAKTPVQPPSRRNERPRAPRRSWLPSLHRSSLPLISNFQPLTSASLQHRAKLRDPHREALPRHRFDAGIAQGIAYEAVAMTVAEGNVGDRRKLPWESAPLLDALHGVSQRLGFRRCAGDRQRVHKSSRAVPLVTV